MGQGKAAQCKHDPSTPVPTYRAWHGQACLGNLSTGRQEVGGVVETGGELGLAEPSACVSNGNLIPGSVREPVSKV